VFARCHDLHGAHGLDALDYLSPCSIDLETLRHCLEGLDDPFLEGCGVEPQEIGMLRALRSEAHLSVG